MTQTDPAYGGAANPVNMFLADIANFSPSGSPNALQNIIGQIEGSTSPQMAIYDLQSALAGNQFNLNTAQYQLSGNQLEQQAANQLQQLGISGQQIGLQGRGLLAEEALLGTTTALEQQEYAKQAQQYPEQLAQATMNYGYNKQNMAGNLAAQGALNTAGSRNQQSQLASQYWWQTQDIQRAQALAGLQQQATTAQQQYSAGDLARQQENLALVARANGLSQQEVLQQLGFGLAQAGLDYKQNVPQLLNSLAGIMSGELQTAGGAAGSLGLLSGLAGFGNSSNLNLFSGFSPGVTAGR